LTGHSLIRGFLGCQKRRRISKLKYQKFAKRILEHENQRFSVQEMQSISLNKKFLWNFFVLSFSAVFQHIFQAA